MNIGIGLVKTISPAIGLPKLLVVLYIWLRPCELLPIPTPDPQPMSMLICLLVHPCQAMVMFRQQYWQDFMCVASPTFLQDTML